jgi:hypothetical protein
LLIRTERVPHHGVVLVRAEDQPERWIGHAVRDLFQSRWPHGPLKKGHAVSDRLEDRPAGRKSGRTS